MRWSSSAPQATCLSEDLPVSPSHGETWHAERAGGVGRQVRLESRPAPRTRAGQPGETRRSRPRRVRQALIRPGGGTAGAIWMRSGSSHPCRKPFGSDLESAQTLNRILLGTFQETEIARIDHYLGKRPVSNMLFNRFANSFLEPFWSRSVNGKLEELVSKSGRAPQKRTATAAAPGGALRGLPFRLGRWRRSRCPWQPGGPAAAE